MQTPALEQLMGSYFHQDWFDEHGDEWANVQDFLDHEPGSGAVVGEIAAVLAQFESEEAIRDYLWSIGSYYTPAEGTGGYRAWLRRIADRATTSARAPDGTSDA